MTNMKFCINCDHPDLCHDMNLKICYRVAPRCQCVNYTEAPELEPKAEVIPQPIAMAPIQMPAMDAHTMNDIMLNIIKNMNTSEKLTE